MCPKLNRKIDKEMPTRKKVMADMRLIASLYISSSHKTAPEGCVWRYVSKEKYGNPKSEGDSEIKQSVKTQQCTCAVLKNYQSNSRPTSRGKYSWNNHFCSFKINNGNGKIDTVLKLNIDGMFYLYFCLPAT